MIIFTDGGLKAHPAKFEHHERKEAVDSPMVSHSQI
jgi:hypothetical protein